MHWHAQAFFIHCVVHSLDAAEIESELFQQKSAACRLAVVEMFAQKVFAVNKDLDSMSQECLLLCSNIFVTLSSFNSAVINKIVWVKVVATEDNWWSD